MREPQVARAPDRIMVVVTAMGAGGSERVISTLVNHWSGQGRAVTLVTFEVPETAPYYPLNPQVNLKQLGLKGSKSGLIFGVSQGFKRIAALRQVINAANPDVIVSFLTKNNVLSLLATRGLSVPVIVSERNNPELQSFGPIWRSLRAALYPRAYALVTMTARAMAYFPPASRPRGRVIPNPVVLPAGWSPKRNGRTLTAVGRLVEQKGFDLLLEAFAKIAAQFPSWNLVIWGEGEKRAQLEALRDRLGLNERVAMPGVTASPGAWIETADVFVLSSRFEGWGIVLTEAMAAGLPVISFDCPYGPREMITPGIDGILVPPENVTALADALTQVLNDAALRTSLGAAAQASTLRFAPEHVLAAWDSIIADAAAARR